MIADPPFELGAVHIKATWALPLVPDRPVGAPAVVDGVNALDVLVAPVPTELIALTLNV